MVCRILKLEVVPQQDAADGLACDDLDAAESRLNLAMQGSSELQINQGENPELIQMTDDDATLVWRGRLPPQAKYNSKGETVFWAVNAKKVNCETNDEQQCLQVKPVIYNNQGVKIREGKWSVFTGELEGYQHDGQHEEVLRLQRYRLGTNDSIETDESPENDINDDSYAYVLDAVIESVAVQ